MSPDTLTTAERMHSAFAIEMSIATKRRHLASIADALVSVGSGAQTLRSSRWRLRVPALVASLMLVLPFGAAIASEGAVPGDLLYPVKRLVEPVRSVVDSDVVAEHRVGELAELIGQQASSDRVADAVADARDAVSDLPPDHDLHADFDRLTDRALSVPDSDEVEPEHAPLDPETQRSSTDSVSDVPTDRSHDTDTPAGPPPSDTTTDTQHRDDGSDAHEDEPPRDRDDSPRDG